MSRRDRIVRMGVSGDRLSVVSLGFREIAKTIITTSLRKIPARMPSAFRRLLKFKVR